MEPLVQNAKGVRIGRALGLPTSSVVVDPTENSYQSILGLIGYDKR